MCVCVCVCVCIYIYINVCSSFFVYTQGKGNLSLVLSQELPEKS